MARGYNAGESRAIYGIKPRKEVFFGRIPEIFGYNISAIGTSEREVMSKMRASYNEWKKGAPDPTTNFKKSFEEWSGNVFKFENRAKDFVAFSNLVDNRRAAMEASESVEKLSNILGESLDSMNDSFGYDVWGDTMNQIVQAELTALPESFKTVNGSQLGAIAKATADKLEKSAPYSKEQIKSDMASLAGNYYKAILSQAWTRADRNVPEADVVAKEVREAAAKEVAQQVYTYASRDGAQSRALNDLLTSVARKAFDDIFKGAQELIDDDR
jgi:hypothetical protein